MTRASGSYSVMASRAEPADGLDFFPTPPWSTRALCKYALHLVPGAHPLFSAWEPAAGEGHMAEVLREYFGNVYASDVHDYGRGYAVGSFVGIGPDRAEFDGGSPDFIITNPPFNLALDFAERAIDEARCGAALLVRSTWAEGGQRFSRLFSKTPPSIIAQFSERVPMIKGRWDPKASTATGYAWFVWLKSSWSLGGSYPRFMWIPPGCRVALTKPDDQERFAKAMEAAE